MLIFTKILGIVVLEENSSTSTNHCWIFLKLTCKYLLSINTNKNTQLQIQIQIQILLPCWWHQRQWWPQELPCSNSLALVYTFAGPLCPKPETFDIFHEFDTFSTLHIFGCPPVSQTLKMSALQYFFPQILFLCNMTWFNVDKHLLLYLCFQCSCERITLTFIRLTTEK